MFLKRKSSVGFAGPSFLGHQMGKFCPKKGPPILQWVLIKAFAMISRVYNNQSTQKRGNQGKKGKVPHPRRQMIYLRRWTTRGTSSSQTPSGRKKHVK